MFLEKYTKLCTSNTYFLNLISSLKAMDNSFDYNKEKLDLINNIKKVFINNDTKLIQNKLTFGFLIFMKLI